MTASRMLPAMDIHHPNEEHDTQYFISKNRFPTDESNNLFELFICMYDSNHKVTSKRWNTHIQNCRKLHGNVTRKCVFNAQHHIAELEWDWHYETCADRNIIRQDIAGSNSGWKMATKVNHNPQWDQPESGDNWEDEIDEDATPFNLNVGKGMPMSLLPQDEEPQEYVEYDEDEFQEIGEGEDVTVSMEALVPEKPANWNDMDKQQKKNHNRKYNRQQKRLNDAGLSKEDFAPETDPKKWTEQERNAKLEAIKAAYPMAIEKMQAERVDYTSLLNIVCQKTKLNLPTYTEWPAGSRGGFASKCQVRDKFYHGQEYCSTKKEAKHNAAKWALLAMEIEGLDGISANRSKPIHPKLLTHTADLREANEAGRLIAAGFQAKKNSTS